MKKSLRNKLNKSSKITLLLSSISLLGGMLTYGAVDKIHTLRYEREPCVALHYNLQDRCNSYVKEKGYLTTNQKKDISDRLLELNKRIQEDKESMTSLEKAPEFKEYIKAVNFKKKIGSVCQNFTIGGFCLFGITALLSTLGLDYKQVEEDWKKGRNSLPNQPLLRK